MATILTTSEYKAAVNISSSEYDAQLAALIPMINDYIEHYCNRVFGAAEYSERDHGVTDQYGRYLFTVENYPVASVSELTLRFYGTDAEIDIDTSLLDLFNDSGIIYYSRALPLGNGIVIRDEYKDQFYYDITYSGGAPVPPSVKLAAIQMTADNMKYLQDTVTASGTQSVGALSSIQIGDYKEAYETNQTVFEQTHDEKTGIILTKTVKDLLQPFRRSGLNLR